jgi:hypothetical protein
MTWIVISALVIPSLHVSNYSLTAVTHIDILNGDALISVLP